MRSISLRWMVVDESLSCERVAAARIAQLEVLRVHPVRAEAAARAEGERQRQVVELHVLRVVTPSLR
jgi:hypothetical protein